MPTEEELNAGLRGAQKPRDRRAEAARRTERNKNDGETRKPAPSSPLNEELKVIRRVARALENMTPEGQARILAFVSNSLQQMRLSRGLNDALSNRSLAGGEKFDPAWKESI